MSELKKTNSSNCVLLGECFFAKLICMFTLWYANAGRNHSVRIDDNSTFERVEEFKYLGTTLTNQNSIPEEIKS